MEIRPATLDDLDGIVAIEEKEFGPIGEDAAASREIMAARIQLLNANDGRWFWIAIHKKEVVGDIVLQPTSMRPEDVQSWMHSTDDGTLQATCDHTGDNIDIVSLAGDPQCRGAAELLMHASVVRWAEHGGKYFFVSRMPGYQASCINTGVTPEVYWQQRRGDGGPLDKMLHMYWAMSGHVQPKRLLLNGFPPDEESGGHGVLFVLEDPYRAIRSTAYHAYSAGVSYGVTLAGKNKRGK